PAANRHRTRTSVLHWFGPQGLYHRRTDERDWPHPHLRHSRLSPWQYHLRRHSRRRPHSRRPRRHHHGWPHQPRRHHRLWRLRRQRGQHSRQRQPHQARSSGRIHRARQAGYRLRHQTDHRQHHHRLPSLPALPFPRSVQSPPHLRQRRPRRSLHQPHAPPPTRLHGISPALGRPDGRQRTPHHPGRLYRRH